LFFLVNCVFWPVIHSPAKLLVAYARHRAKL
jgi:hypothetical protein